MAKPRTLLTLRASPAARRLPSEKELFETADMVSFLFELPEAAALKQRFLEDAEIYRDWLRVQNKEEARVITYLLHLILRCPQLLKRPPECEWVMRELEEFLVQRTVDPRQDGVFWAAMKLVRKELRIGRPRDKALDFFRYGFIQNLMHPPRIPECAIKTFTKTKAVDQLAEAEQKLFKRSPDTRSIWRSYQRVEQFLQEVAPRMRTESSRVPLLTKKIDREPRDNPKVTEKGRRRTQHAKHVKRK